MERNAWLALTAAQLKTLYSLAVDRGLTPAFSPEDVDRIMSDESLSSVDASRLLQQMHRGVHELLYAPPR